MVELVSLVTITRNNSTFLEKFLNALDKTTYSCFELILIDNASTSSFESLNEEIVRKRASKKYNVTKIYSNVMNSFAKNCNIGANAANGSILVFVNDDTEPTPEWLMELVSCFERRKAGVVGAKMFFENGKIQHAGIAYRKTPHFHPGHVWWNKLSKDDPRVCEEREMQAVSGGCMLVPKSLFLHLHGFDEKYVVAGYEDCDFCCRVREAGHSVWFAPKSELVHHEKATQKTFDEKFRHDYFVKNHNRFARLWSDKVELDYSKFEPGVE